MPADPYQLVEVLGSCQAGTVWSAVDAQGTALTVALLDPAFAQDKIWRDAFANAADALGRQGHGFALADFAAASPWVAYLAPGGPAPGAERIFVALGMDYLPRQPRPDGVAVPGKTRPTTSAWAPPPSATQPAVTQPPAVIQPPSVTQPAAGPEPGPDPDTTVTHRIEVAPALPEPAPQAAPTSPGPMSWPLRPISDSQPPVTGIPRWIRDPEQPVTSEWPGEGADPVPLERARKRPRTGLWAGIIGLVVVLLIGGGAAAFALRGPGGSPTPTSPNGRASATLASPPPAPSPLSPGLEPPKPGTWPAAWPKFLDTDQVQTLTALDGLGFTLKVPVSWKCVPAGRAQGFAKYYCGAPPGSTPQIGGELIVRDCAKPCSGDQQSTMRQAEEAWGLGWIRTGRFCTYAESNGLQVDGVPRYGLVVVAFWRGGADGAIDHELVFRMAAPAEGAGQLRRVANYLRDTLIF
jgi:hypothetical protein